MTTLPLGPEERALGTQVLCSSHNHSLRRAQSSSPTSYPHRCWGHLIVTMNYADDTTQSTPTKNAKTPTKTTPLGMQMTQHS